MTQTSIATSADYADALLVARRGKHLLFLLLLLMLMGQIAFFFVARYTNIIPPATATAAATMTTTPSAAAPATPTTAPSDAAATAEAAATPAPTRAALALNYFTSLMTFFGMILPILLGLDLLLILNIMLVGRLLGLARTTSAFLWCLLLMLLLFPVQVFFGGTTDAGDFRLPGLLYTWNELLLHAKFPTDRPEFAITKWARFVVMPLAAIVLLAMIQIKSNRGLRQALGEATPDLDRPM